MGCERGSAMRSDAAALAQIEADGARVRTIIVPPSQCEAGTMLCVGLSRSRPPPIRIVSTSCRLARRTVGVIARRRAFRPGPRARHALWIQFTGRDNRDKPRRRLCRGGGSQTPIGRGCGTPGSPRCASSCAMRRCTVDWLVLALVYDLAACTHSSLKMAALKHIPGQLVAPLPH